MQEHKLHGTKLGPLTSTGILPQASRRALLTSNLALPALPNAETYP